MNIGTLALKNNLVLAPLLNVTTAPYRIFNRNFYDIGLVCVPMFYVKRIANSPESIQNELEKIEKESPVSVQLIGNDLEAFKTSISHMESYKFDVLDINAGCPSKRAINSKRGGYLLKDLEKLKKILNIATKCSSKVISLKTRVGFSNSKNIKEIGKMVNDCEIDFLSIHARTVKNRFDDTKLELDAVKQLKEVVKIPLIGNGDIHDPISAKQFLDYTKVDALMVGRGSIGNPMIFSQIHDYLETNHFEIETVKRILAQFEGRAIEEYQHMSISETIRYLNTARTYHRARALYEPGQKIKTPVHYIKASETRITKPGNWNQYTRQPIKFYEVAGNHYSILQQNEVIELAKTFSAILP